MKSYPMTVPATDENFDEIAYRKTNPDVAIAVSQGKLESGFKHFQLSGKKEGRKIQSPPEILDMPKKRKLERIKPILRSDLSYIKNRYHYDFLTESLCSKYNIVDANAVSGYDYDIYMMELIKKHENGLVLDCGAGKRPVYYENVVNFEIVAYDSTDVRGVGEILPFQDETFDAVISNAVLEHVKDPFQCAKEIARVLKSGGTLFCVVPLLAPVHAYPNHYYNMTSQGLVNLFEKWIDVEKCDVYGGLLPIFSLTWILRSWAEGLTGDTKNEFLNMKISDLIGPGEQYINRSFVQSLPRGKNFELATCTMLTGHKNASFIR